MLRGNKRQRVSTPSFGEVKKPGRWIKAFFPSSESRPLQNANDADEEDKENQTAPDGQIDSDNQIPFFTYLPNVADEGLGCRVAFCTDEYFGECRNMLGKDIKKSWQTRRRRDIGHDWALIELRHPCILRGIEIDISDLDHYAPQISLEAAYMRDFDQDLLRFGTSQFPLMTEISHDPEQNKNYIQFKTSYQDVKQSRTLIDAVSALLDDTSETWEEVLPMVRLRKNQKNYFAIEVEDDQTPGPKVNWIRVNLLPDGGLRKLKVFGEPILSSSNIKVAEMLASNSLLDHASTLVGGCVVYATSNQEGAKNLTYPYGLWTTSCQPLRAPIIYPTSRDPEQPKFNGDERVIIKLAARCRIRRIEISTKGIFGTCPYSVDVMALDCTELFGVNVINQIQCLRAAEENADWIQVAKDCLLEDDSVAEILPDPANETATHIMVIIQPDGCLESVRVLGHQAADTASDNSAKQVNKNIGDPRRARHRDSTTLLLQSLSQAFKHTDP